MRARSWTLHRDPQLSRPHPLLNNQIRRFLMESLDTHLAESLHSSRNTFSKLRARSLFLRVEFLQCVAGCLHSAESEFLSFYSVGMNLCTLLCSVWLGLYTHLAICNRCFESLNKKAKVYSVYAVTCASASACVCVNFCTKCMCVHAYIYPMRTCAIGLSAHLPIHTLHMCVNASHLPIDQ